MRDRLRRRALWAATIALCVVGLYFAITAFLMDPRLSRAGIEIHLAGIPIMTIPYGDIDQVRVRSRTAVYFSGNPLRRVRVGGCVRDEVVELTRRHGWVTSVVVCPWNRAGFVRDVEARRHS
jgi:hypothetical protein